VALVLQYKPDGVVYLLANEHNTEDFFSSPCNSTLLNICVVRERHLRETFLAKFEVDRMAVCFPISDGYALFPLRHEAEKR